MHYLESAGLFTELRKLKYAFLNFYSFLLFKKMKKKKTNFIQKNCINNNKHFWVSGRKHLKHVKLCVSMNNFKNLKI